MTRHTWIAPILGCLATLAAIGFLHPAVEAAPERTSAAAVDVETLIEQLGAPQWRLRNRASRALAARGASVVKALRRARAGSEDVEVISRIDEIMAQLQKRLFDFEGPLAEKVEPTAFEGFFDMHPYQRRQLVNNLSQLGGVLSASVMASVSELDDDQAVRKTALGYLMHFADSDARRCLEVLTPATSDHAELGRARALAALGRPKEALEAWNDVADHISRPEAVEQMARTWPRIVTALPDPGKAVDAMQVRLSGLFPPSAAVPPEGSAKSVRIRIMLEGLYTVGAQTDNDRALLAGLAGRLRLDPKAADAAVRDAAGLARRGRYETVHRLLQMVPVRRDQTLEVGLLRWLAAVETGRPAGAATRWLNNHADSRQAMVSAAEFLDSLNEVRHALSWWDRAATAPGDVARSLTIRLELADRMIGAGDLARGAEQLRLALALSTDKQWAQDAQLTERLNDKVEQLGRTLLARNRPGLVWSMTAPAADADAPSLLSLVLRLLAGEALKHDTTVLQQRIDKLTAGGPQRMKAAKALAGLGQTDRAAALLKDLSPNEKDPAAQAALLIELAGLNRRVGRTEAAVRALVQAHKLLRVDDNAALSSARPTLADTLNATLLAEARAMLLNLHTAEAMQLASLVRGTPAQELQACYLEAMAAGEAGRPVAPPLAKARKVAASRQERFEMAARLEALGRIDLARLEYREIANARGDVNVYVESRLKLARLAAAGARLDIKEIAEHLGRVRKIIKLDRAQLPDDGGEARNKLMETALELAGRAWRLGKLEEARTLTELVDPEHWRDPKVLWLRYLIKRDADSVTAANLLKDLHDGQYDNPDTMSMAVDQLLRLGGYDAALSEFGRFDNLEADRRMHLAVSRLDLAQRLEHTEAVAQAAAAVKAMVEKNPDHEGIVRRYGTLAPILATRHNRAGGASALARQVWAPGVHPVMDAVCRVLGAPSGKAPATVKDLWPDEGRPDTASVVSALNYLGRAGAVDTIDGLARQWLEASGADPQLTFAVRKAQSRQLAVGGQYDRAATMLVEALRQAAGLDRDNAPDHIVRAHDEATQLIAVMVMLGRPSEAALLLNRLPDPPERPDQLMARRVLAQLCRHNAQDGPFRPDVAATAPVETNTLADAAMLLADMGLPDAALSVYDQAFAATTDLNAKISITLQALELLSDHARYEEGLPWLDRLAESIDRPDVVAVNGGPGSPRARQVIFRALSLIEAKQPERARRLLALHFSNPDMVHFTEAPMLAAAYRKLGQADKLKQVIEGTRTEITDRLVRGRIYEHRLNAVAWPLRDFPELLDLAVAASEKSVALDPLNAPCLDTLAELYYRQGRTDLAVKTIDRALAVPVAKRWPYYVGQRAKFMAARSDAGKD